ncbi:MAG TPA: DUF6259 domain-containing protein [Phycisphaerae bacterium]|nr:DUF6259 domain-containing protein [Phycisphaerae bacterium]
MKLRQEKNVLIVDAPTFTARFEGAGLVSFVDRRTHTEFCRAGAAGFPLELFYVNQDSLGQDKNQHVEVKLLSDVAARVILTGNDSDRELLVRLDGETGDLCVRPSGRGARRGVVSVRWNVPFAAEAKLILPCINGMLVEKDRAFPGDDRFPWPYRWNAQLAIAERGGAAMMVHCQDTAWKFKALKLAREDGLTTLGFESEQAGPLWDNRGSGGVEWRLNAQEGGWQAAGRRYRDWLQRTYDLQAQRAQRPEWVDQVRLAVCWASAHCGLLDALAKIYPPPKTLIHLSNWRTSKYDADYPDYAASDDARAFLRKANEMGFRVAPHFNYFACYNDHPLFASLRDWQIRSASRNEPEGWYWPPETHAYTRMGYIHPGLGRWRRILIDAVRDACAALAAPAAFIDQTLCTWNTDNGIVENATTVEGMAAMQEEFAAIDPAVVLAGEGCNEVSFQRECFAQGHIHDGWFHPLEDRHVAAAHPICSFLWDGHTRLVGYYHLGPSEPDVDLGIEVYRRMGAIPTLIPREANTDPSALRADHPAVRKLVELADAK